MSNVQLSHKCISWHEVTKLAEEEKKNRSKVPAEEKKDRKKVRSKKQ